MQVRVSISSTMFLALCGLLNVAQETLPKLEYLTNCDELIMVSTVIVFGVNVWNCILLLLWNATSTRFSDGNETDSFENVPYHGTSCPTIDTATIQNYGSFPRLLFRVLGAELQSDEREIVDSFATLTLEAHDACFAARLDHGFAFALVVIYRALCGSALCIVSSFVQPCPCCSQASKC